MRLPKTMDLRPRAPLCDTGRLENATLQVLQPYLQRMRFRAGSYLWREGDAPRYLVLLEQGRVKVVKEQPDGRTMLLYLFCPGELFGFLPFLDGQPYPATAVAVEDVAARIMDWEGLEAAIRRDPEVAMVLLRHLGLRLRQAFDRIADQTQRAAVARVAAALLLLVPPEASGKFLFIDVPAPLYAFASDVGLTPETFSRSVTRLVQAGILHRLGSGSFQVLDADRLREAAAGRLLNQSASNDP